MNEAKQNEEKEWLQGANKVFDYLVAKYGARKMPVKRCTFVKMMKLEAIPCSFRAAGRPKSNKFYSIEEVEDWYAKSTGKKL